MLGLVWVLVEKLIEGKLGAKARFAVKALRGNEEADEDIKVDSPTINKININVFPGGSI